MFIKKLNNLMVEKGQVTIATVLIILSAAVVLVVALGLLTFNEIKKINNVVKSAQSYYVSEGGIEDALLRIRTNMNYPNPGSYTLSVGDGSTTVDISGPIENLVITSKGDVTNRIRKLAVNLNATPSTVNVNFNYGVQVGEGGVEMDSNSEIIGNVYSNGPIIGVISRPDIIGDAFSAGSGGLIDKIDIVKSDPLASDGNAHAHTISDSTIEGTPYCQVESGNNKPCDTSQPDPDIQDMPMSDSDISTLRSQAAAGGEIPSVTVNGGDSVSLGPVKIAGNLVVESNAALTVTGTIWVTGDITFSSNILVQLDSGYGTESGVIFSDDGKIFIDSNVTVCGSEGGIIGSCNVSSGSYLMFLSTFPLDPVTPAIDMNSNTSTAILYTNNGAVRLNSNIDVFEVTAYKLKISSNASVTYESGLADVNFFSGPGGTFKIKSWQEVQ